jgi:hypothetical protein
MVGAGFGGLEVAEQLDQVLAYPAIWWPIGFALAIADF